VADKIQLPNSAGGDIPNGLDLYGMPSLPSSRSSSRSLQSIHSSLSSMVTVNSTQNERATRSLLDLTDGIPDDIIIHDYTEDNNDIAVIGARGDITVTRVNN
jgi:hypothetical protein